MILDTFHPLTSALASEFHGARNVLPTQLDTAAMRGLDASVRRQSFWSAQTMLEDLLTRYKESVGTLLAGKSNLATERLDIKNLLDALGLERAGDNGDLSDITSDSRINLVLKTNQQLAQGAGHVIQQNDPKVLDTFPALELVRFEARKVPRDWEQRWREAARDSGDLKAYAAQADGGRMVALKDSPIWDSLGSSDLFPDGLDNPFPPFAFNSGMWTQDVSWDEAQELGLVDDETVVKPRLMNFADLFNTPELSD
jgi:hypothetical protein